MKKSTNIKTGGMPRLATRIEGVPDREPTVNFTIRLPRCVREAVTTEEMQAAAVKIWKRKGAK